jgi:hypothetical protein
MCRLSLKQNLSPKSKAATSSGTTSISVTGAGMNFYDPRKSYRTCGPNTVTARQNLEMTLDESEFGGVPEKIGDLSMVVVLKASTLRKLLRDHPEYFDDAPFQSWDEMDNQAREAHTNLLEQLKDPDSHCSKFARWVDEKRSK